MQVRVKLEGLAKLKLASKVEDDEGVLRLKTTVSFEVDGKVESLARILNLAHQRQPMFAVIGCEQAMFDLQLVQVREEDEAAEPVEAAEQSEADKGAATGEEPVTDMPIYRVLQSESGEVWEGRALSPEAACEQAGLFIDECSVKVRTEKGGWAKVKLTPSAPVEEAAAEAIESGNGQGDSADIGAPEQPVVLESLTSWLDAHAVPDATGMYTASCPFHNDRANSLRIWPEDDIYDCPVCGSSGDLARLSERLGIGRQGAPVTA